MPAQNPIDLNEVKPYEASSEDISKLAQKYNLHISSGKRSRAEQDKLIKEGKTKAKNSFHLYGQAYDVAGDAEGMKKFYQELRTSYGAGLKELLNEGNHIHVAYSKSQQTQQAQAPATENSSFQMGEDETKNEKPPIDIKDVKPLQLSKSSSKSGGWTARVAELTKGHDVAHEQPLVDPYLSMPKSPYLPTATSAPKEADLSTPEAMQEYLSQKSGEGLRKQVGIPSALEQRAIETRNTQTEARKSLAQAKKDRIAAQVAAEDAKHYGVTNLARHTARGLATGITETIGNVGEGFIEHSPAGQALSLISPSTMEKIQAARDLFHQEVQRQQEEEGEGFGQTVGYEGGKLLPMVMAPGGVPTFAGMEYLNAK